MPYMEEDRVGGSGERHGVPEIARVRMILAYGLRLRDVFGLRVPEFLWSIALLYARWPKILY